jgi:hypothetical protein
MTVTVTNQFPSLGIEIQAGCTIRINTPKGNFSYEIKNSIGSSYRGKIIDGKIIINFAAYGHINSPSLFIKSDDAPEREVIRVYVLLSG